MDLKLQAYNKDHDLAHKKLREGYESQVRCLQQRIMDLV